MTSPEHRFADVELVVGAWLRDQVGVRVVADTPADLEEKLPLIRIERALGWDRRWEDRARIDMDCFGGTRAEMWLVAEQARDSMLRLAGRKVLGQLVDSVHTETAPSYLEWGNDRVKRAVASYRLLLRPARPE